MDPGLTPSCITWPYHASRPYATVVTKLKQQFAFTVMQECIHNYMDSDVYKREVTLTRKVDLAGALALILCILHGRRYVLQPLFLNGKSRKNRVGGGGG